MRAHLDTIARRIERSGGAGFATGGALPDDRGKTIHSAVVLANSLAHSKIVVFTRAGFMARFTSILRPHTAPIYAFAPSIEICRHLKQLWGVHPLLLPLEQDPERTIEAAEAELSAGSSSSPATASSSSAISSQGRNASPPSSSGS